MIHFAVWSILYAVVAVPVAAGCDLVCRWLEDERGWTGLAPPGTWERGITAMLWPVFLIGTILFLAADFLGNPVRRLGECVESLTGKRT